MRKEGKQAGTEGEAREGRKEGWMWRERGGDEWKSVKETEGRGRRTEEEREGKRGMLLCDSKQRSSLELAIQPPNFSVRCSCAVHGARDSAMHRTQLVMQ